MSRHDYNLLEIAKIAALRLGSDRKIENKAEAIKYLKAFSGFKSDLGKDLFLKSVCRIFLEIERIKQPEYTVNKLVKKLQGIGSA